MAEQVSQLLILFGGLFLISLIVAPIAERFKIPRVTLLIISGIIIGPNGIGVLDGIGDTWFPFIADITLLIIGYLLGARLTRGYLTRYIGGVLSASLVITIATVTIVGGGLWLAGCSIELAVLLGAIAAATDPAATLDVIRQRNVTNHFSELLQGIVAVDDVLGLLIFSLALAALKLFEHDAFLEPMQLFLWEVGGALFLGAAVGGALAFLLNRRPAHKPVIVESLGFIFLCGGLAIHLEISFLLAAMTMGLVVVNFAAKAADHLHEIENVEQPFLVLFFIMAGATLNLNAGAALGFVGILFIVLRLAGRYFGGCLVFGLPELHGNRRWLGLSLLPQAGVAMGMALVGANYYPQWSDLLLSVTVAATVVFEIIGPVLTNWALQRIK